MKTFVVLSVALAVLAPSFLAQDDGSYRPGQYGDDGRYRPSDEGRYKGGEGGFRASQTSYRTYSDYQNARGLAAQPLSQVIVAQPSIVRPLAAVPASGRYSDAYATILREVNDVGINGYRYEYQTSNAIAAEETGRIDSDLSGTEARGSFEFVGDDGVKYRIEYTAGADGFRPIGAHIPV